MGFFKRLWGKRPAESKPPDRASQHPKLLQTLVSFLEAKSWEQALQVVEQYPELLTDEADKLLGKVIAAQPDKHVVEMLNERRDLLRRYRIEGPAAFAMLVQPPAPQASEIVQDAVDVLLNAVSITETRQIVEQHPELLSDEADSLLAQLSAIAAERGQSLGVQILEDYRRLLRRCRDEGIETAFSYMKQPIKQRVVQEFNALLGTLLSAPNWDEMQRLLEQHPELLRSDADATLEIMASEASDEKQKMLISGYRQLLQLCRSQSPSKVLAHLPGSITPAAYLTLPLTLNTLAQTLSLEEAVYVIQKYPELLSEAADLVLERMVATQTDKQSAQLLLEYRKLLQNCRTQGVDKILAQSRRVSTVDRMTLPYLLHKLINKATWAEAQRLVELNPDLLSEEAQAMLASLIAAQKDEASAQVLNGYENLLRRCREEGISAAFDHLSPQAKTAGPGGPALNLPWELAFNLSRDQIKSTMLNLDTELRNEMLEKFLKVAPPEYQALGNFLATGSWTKQRELIEKHPELSSDWAIQTIERHIASIRRGGYSEEARAQAERKWTEGLALLRRCREVGVEKAFTEKTEALHPEPEVARSIGDWSQIPSSVLEVIQNLFPFVSELEIDACEVNSLEDFEHYLESRLAQCPNIQKELEEALGTTTPPSTLPDTLKPFLMPIVWPVLGKVLHTPTHQGDAPRYVNLYRWALVFCERDKAPEFWALLQDRLGNCLISTSSKGMGLNIEQAIEAFQQALQVRTREARPHEWAESQIGLAVAYFERIQGDKAENIEQALSFCKQALEVLDSQNNPALWSRAVMEQALIYQGRGRLLGDRAENLEHAIGLYEQVLKAGALEIRANAMMNLATAYQERLLGDKAENLERSIDLYQQVSQLVRRETMPLEWAKLTIELGHAYVSRDKGDPAENIELAIKMYTQALEVRTREAWPTEWARTMDALGVAYLKRRQGNCDDNIALAIQHLEQSLKLWWDKWRPDEVARTMGMLATAHLSRSGDRTLNFKRAVDLYQSALERITPQTQPLFCLNTSHLLGTLHFDEGQWDAAHAAYNQAIDAGEMLYQATATELSRQIELSEIGDFFANDAYCLVRMERFTESVERLEGNRTRALVEVLARDRAELRQAKPTDRDAFEAACERLKALEVEVRAFKTNESGAPRSFVQISDDMNKTRKELAEVVDRIRTDVPNFMPAALDFKSISEAAAPGCPIVYLIATTRGSLALIVLPGAEELKAEQIVWLDNFTRDDLKKLLWPESQKAHHIPLVTVAREQNMTYLGESVMGPLAARLSHLGFHQVTLIPGGCLALLPLHSARYQVGEKFHYFLDDFEVNYAYSARALAVSRRANEAASVRPRSLFGLGDPPHTNLQRLAFARIEMEEVRSLFPLDSGRILYEAQATRAVTLQGAPGCTYLHFSCHGSFEPNDPLCSALLLAGEDRLTLQDVLDNLNLSGARLAVLSACKTAIIDYSHVPDEAVGMPAGFLQTGVPGVVGSLWPVDDLSTALLMRRFYLNHLHGDPAESEGVRVPLAPAEALRRAQLWLRDQVTAGQVLNYITHAQYQGWITHAQASTYRQKYNAWPETVRPFNNPYYWAAFAIYGV